MRQSEILVLLIACLLFAIGMPSRPTQPELQVLQEQEAEEEEVSAENEEYYIEFKAQDQSENEIADIMWLKEAAQIALDAGIPYFNVTRQNIRQELDKKQKFVRQVVEGEIQLDNDPFSTQYDANEIMGLTLPDVR